MTILRDEDFLKHWKERKYTGRLESGVGQEGLVKWVQSSREYPSIF